MREFYESERRLGAALGRVEAALDHIHGQLSGLIAPRPALADPRPDQPESERVRALEAELASLYAIRDAEQAQLLDVVERLELLLDRSAAQHDAHMDAGGK